MTEALPHQGIRSLSRWPRGVAALLLVAIVRHTWTALTTLDDPGNIGGLDWSVLALCEFLLLLVALHAPAMFQLRNFRLVGVAVAANTALILIPLPDVVGVYRLVVPDLMVLSIALGVAAMAVVFLAMSRWVAERPDRPSAERGLHEAGLPVGILALTLVILPAWFAAVGVPPLFGLLTGGGDLALERQAALSNLDPPVLRLAFGLLRNLLIMFAVGWFVADAARTPRDGWRRRNSTQVAVGAAVGLGVFLAMLTTERAIVGELLVVCAVAYLTVRRRELSPKVIGVLVTAALVFPFAVGVLGGAGGPGAVLAGLRRRAFYLPAEVMTRYFVEFPQFHEHLWGTAIPKLSYLTGGETFDLSAYIYTRYYQRSGDIVGNANGAFFGAGWANFGWWGVVLWGALAAVTLVLLDKWIDRLPLRSSAALRGLGVIVAVLTTSSDLFRSVLGFGPGFLDLLVLVSLVTWIDHRRTVHRRIHGETLRSGPDLTVPTPTS